MLLDDGFKTLKCNKNAKILLVNMITIIWYLTSNMPLSVV